MVFFACRAKESELADCKLQVNTLKETLAMQNKSKEALSQDLSVAQKDLRQTTGKLDAANKELQQQKQVRHLCNAASW